LADNQETSGEPPKFDFTAYPPNTLFHDRREPKQGQGDANPAAASQERKGRKERRRRVDPTTFEKQYTDDELEFMTAMQRFKVQSGKAFPSYGEVLRVARELGYEPPQAHTPGSSRRRAQ
jgi:hypothetical protein